MIITTSRSNQPSKHSLQLAARARQLIPGGAHTYAKGDDQFPENAPPFLARGEGCHVYDLDGRRFIEYGMGLRAVTLGHGYPPVINAVRRQLEFGCNFGRPAPVEVECAEQFLRLISAEMVKFCKDGSSALDAAVKLSRAHTGRVRIAVCGDHPFFSTSDWFIGSTPMSAGIPQWIREQTVKFRYNDIESVVKLFEDYPGEIACVILEPARTEEPKNNFLKDLRDLCARNGTVLVFDEMITGFRWHRSGAQHVYGVTPDLSAFGKAMANGFAVSALAGRRELMELGGTAQGRERVFLLSTTHGAETHSLAAAIATMSIYEKEAVTERLAAAGRRLRSGVEAHIARLELGEYFQCVGKDCCILFATRNSAREPSQEFRTLFMQELISRGVLAPSFVVSYSHGDKEIDETVQAVGEALDVYRKAIDGGLECFLKSRPVKPALRPFA